MDSDLRSTLLKVAIPLCAIIVVLVVSKKRGISWKEDLCLVWPRMSVVLLWLALWIGWIVVGEIVIEQLGMQQPGRWKHYSALIIFLRIVAIGFLGPAAEEILMRGIVFLRISRTAIGPIGAIMICAALWAVMHVQYDWKTITLILVDGLLLGTARYRSRSTFMPIMMHSSGNLFSIYQSLHG